MEESSQIKKEFYDKYVVTHFSGFHTFDEREYRKCNIYFEHFIKPHLPSARNSKIVDIGCGSGYFLNYLKKVGYANIYGVDISAEQIELCKKRGISQVLLYDGIEFLKKNPDTFDLVFSANMVEHLIKEQIVKFFKVLYKALKSNGKAILITVNASPLFSGLARYSDFTHEIAFTPLSLKQVCKIGGFQNISIFPIGPIGKTLKSRIRKILSQIVYGMYKLLYIIEFGMEGYRRFPEPVFSSEMLVVCKK